LSTARSRAASSATSASASRRGTSPRISDLVRLTIVSTEIEAEIVRSLLRTEDIESVKRKTDFATGASDAGSSSQGPWEILVSSDALATARELIARE
jgi:hypothetical protein